MTAAAAPLCPECGANQGGPREQCWLCGHELGHVEGSDTPSPAWTEPQAVIWTEPQPFSFSLSSLLLVTTMLAVGLGLVVVFPGIGILLCILMAPVLIRTARVTADRERRGKTVPPAEKVGLFLGSFAVSVVYTVVIGVTAFCSFCGVCLVIFGGVDDANLGAMLFGITICGVAVVGVFTLAALVRWSRRRYGRDVER